MRMIQCLYHVGSHCPVAVMGRTILSGLSRLRPPSARTLFSITSIEVSVSRKSQALSHSIGTIFAIVTGVRQAAQRHIRQRRAPARGLILGLILGGVLGLALGTPAMAHDPTLLAPEYWSVRCAAPEGVRVADVEAGDINPQRCEIFQQLNVKGAAAPVLQFAIGTPDSGPDGTTPAVVMLPLGVMLRHGAVMQVDNGSLYRLAVSHCTDTGCIAPVALRPDTVGELRQGAQVRFMFQNRHAQEFTLPLTLKGFSAALDLIS